jgi:hypothetical protein
VTCCSKCKNELPPIDVRLDRLEMEEREARLEEDDNLTEADDWETADVEEESFSSGITMGDLCDAE